jgi:hypothetical protein
LIIYMFRLFQTAGTVMLHALPYEFVLHGHAITT